MFSLDTVNLYYSIRTFTGVIILTEITYILRNILMQPSPPSTYCLMNNMHTELLTYLAMIQKASKILN